MSSGGCVYHVNGGGKGSSGRKGFSGDGDNDGVECMGCLDWTAMIVP